VQQHRVLGLLRRHLPQPAQFALRSGRRLARQLCRLQPPRNLGDLVALRLAIAELFADRLELLPQPKLAAR